MPDQTERITELEQEFHDDFCIMGLDRFLRTIAESLAYTETAAAALVEERDRLLRSDRP